MTNTPKAGDAVGWTTPQGKTTGVVTRKVTDTTSVKGHVAKASKAKPQFEVKSDKSGKKAIHSAEALTPAPQSSAAAPRSPSRAAAAAHPDPDAAKVVSDFRQAVNMTPKALTAWLETDDSRSVGFKGSGNGESVGHRSGRRIVRLLEKNAGDLTAGDRAHMRKVVGYVHRHLAQRPAGDVTETPWRYSLMNWGHDPSRSA